MKYWCFGHLAFAQRSPPSRGAWIEIIRLICLTNSPFVAPLAGGVD